jgi:hypothetical protein
MFRSASILDIRCMVIRVRSTCPRGTPGPGVGISLPRCGSICMHHRRCSTPLQNDPQQHQREAKDLKFRGQRGGKRGPDSEAARRELSKSGLASHVGLQQCDFASRGGGPLPEVLPVLTGIRASGVGGHHDGNTKAHPGHPSIAKNNLAPPGPCENTGFRGMWRRAKTPLADVAVDR